jgi:multiple sugar transport system permease protein
MFTADPSYWHAVRVTVTFAVVAVPLKLAAALGVAMLLNKALRGIALFRGLFYLPSLLGGSVALAIVWRGMFAGDGAFNEFLSFFGIHGKAWVNDPSLGAAHPDAAGHLAVRRAHGDLPGRPQAGAE